MKAWLRDNGLSLALALLFLASLIGMVFSGWSAENENRHQHGQAVIGIAQYLSSGEFLSALMENWESEFLQMWAYVMLTAYLYQRGSPESKDPDRAAAQDRDPALDADNQDAPAPVRAGGLARALYGHSLGLALLALFGVSFAAHFQNSLTKAQDEAMQHGQTAPAAVEYLTSAEFWFESFQNWQSEFLATFVLVVLAIFLRERGSPESKPVGAPHSQTGSA